MVVERPVLGLLLAYGETRAVLVAPVVLKVLGLDVVVVGVPASAQKLLSRGHAVMDGELFIRVGVRHHFK